MAAALVVSLLLSTLQFHSAMLANIVILGRATPGPRGHASSLLTAVFLALIRGQLFMHGPLEFFYSNFERVMDSQFVPLEAQS